METPPPPFWRRETFPVFAVPFGLQLLLCLSTLGRRVFWQDSGFFLTGVHDLSVLYPHGFVLYQLTCWAWTKLFFFLDFTRAVHLYSAVCSASAAGVLALATRSWLLSQGPLRVLETPRTHAALAAIVAGGLAGSGYTFWSSGIAAKGYALTFLILALLLWRMVLAAERGRPSDFTAVAALIGLAWAGHPSVALAGGGLLAFAAFAARRLGGKAMIGRILLAALLAAGPTLLVPLLALRESPTDMGHPTTPGALLEYFVGGRYVGQKGVFAFDPVRARTLQVYFWEEFLGVGLLLLVAGFVRLAKAHRRLLGGLALWTVPYLTVAVLFMMEGQQDFWYVAAWMPFYPVLGLGAAVLAGAARGAATAAVAAAGLLGVGWAAAANHRSIDQHGYEWAETFGRIHLRNLERDGVLLLQSDDLSAIGRALQRVRGERSDVVLVDLQRLGDASGWYERRLQAHHPDLRFPGPVEAPAERRLDVLLQSFLALNVGRGRTFYFHFPLGREYWPPGWEPVPTGPVWRMERAGTASPDPRHWEFPIDAERVQGLFRRPRGILVRHTPEGMNVSFEPYERRILVALLVARQNLADWHFRNGRLEPALTLYESILLLDPLWKRQQTVLHRLGSCALALGREAQAEEMFRAVLEHAHNPDLYSGALVGLGDLERKRGREEQALERYRQAASVPGLSSEVRREAESRLRP